MPTRRKLMLSFAHWPIEDRRRWETAFQSGDMFDEHGAGTRLAAATRRLRLASYGRFLGFLSAKHAKLWGHDRAWLTPEQRTEARAMRLANAERGLRRPVQVLPGNFEVMAGVCPWFDDMKKQKSA